MSALDALARTTGTTLFQVLLTAFQVLLHRYTGQEDVAVATVAAGRGDPESRDHLGNFLHTLILRAQLGLEDPFSAALRRTRACCEAALCHQEVPFQAVVAQLARHPGRDLPVQVAFVLEPASSDSGDWALHQLAVSTGAAKFELSMELDRRDGALIGRVEYRTNCFQRAQIIALIEHYTAILCTVVAAPEARLNTIRLLDQAQQAELLALGRGPEVRGGEGLIHDRIAALARQQPDKTALIWGEERCTFAEFEARANQLAHALLAAGTGRGDRVGIWGDRSGLLLIGQLAVLAVGAAYVPLHPDEAGLRAGRILADASAKLVLSDAAHANQVRALGLTPVPLEGPHDHPTTSPTINVQPDDVAYILYTSGSTGQPKGVLFEHRHFLARGDTHNARERIGPDDVSVMLTSPAFDGALTATWVLFAGGTVVMPSIDTLRDPVALVALMKRHKVTAAAATPSFWRILLPELARAGYRLLLIESGGERLNGALAREMTRLADRVVNEYGPTEAVLYVARWEVPADPPDRIPIGTPLDGVRLYVLDAAGQLAPRGLPGELHIGGPTIARGYLRPDPRHAFRPDPFCPGGRMYRTGDIVRWREDGQLEYLGRRDQQLKLRGHRIEPEEIALCIAEHPAIDHCAVTLRSEPSGDVLVAHFTGQADPVELRAWLRARLPAYLIPANLVPIPQMPLVPNGKPDLRALGQLAVPASPATSATVITNDPLAARLLLLFRAALRNEAIGVYDDFFESGGDSLAGLQLVARADDEGLPLTMRALLQHKTVTALAKALRTPDGLHGTTSLLPLRVEGTQRPFFCVHPAGGSASCYRELALGLPDRPVYGLECVRGYAGERLASMAATYIEAIRQVQPTGPYLLGGWSLGGLIAVEMAAQLERVGETVERIVLIDARPTQNLQQLAFLDHMVNDRAATLALIGRHLATLCGQSSPVNYGDLAALPEEAQMIYFYEKIAKLEVFGASMMAGFVRRFVDDFSQCHSILRDHHSAPCQAPLLLMRATEVSEPYPGFPSMEVPLSDDPDPSYGWATLSAGGCEVRPVPGTHETLIFAPHVETLGAILRASLTTPPSHHAPGQTTPKTNHDQEHISMQNDLHENWDFSPITLPALRWHDESEAPEGIPVLDLDVLSAKSRLATRDAQIKALRDAVTNSGFLYVKNHGISNAEIEAISNETRAFYSKPEAYKGEFDKHSDIRGYSSYRSESIARFFKTGKGKDLCMKYTMGPELTPEEVQARISSDADLASKAYSPNVYPNPAFRNAWVSYYSAVHRVSVRLLELMGDALDLDEESRQIWREMLIDNSAGEVRYLQYPDVPLAACSDIEGNGTDRIAAHFDLGVITLLHQTPCANGFVSLEAKLGENFVKVPAIKGTLVVNLGEVIRLLTGGRVRATVHRVVRPTQEWHRHSARDVVAFFQAPPLNARLRPLRFKSGIGFETMFDEMYAEAGATQAVTFGQLRSRLFAEFFSHVDNPDPAHERDAHLFTPPSA